MIWILLNFLGQKMGKIVQVDFGVTLKMLPNKTLQHTFDNPIQKNGYKKVLKMSIKKL